MNKANKIIFRIEGILALTIAIIALASAEFLKSTAIDLKFGSINAIICGAIIIFTSTFFINDNKEKVKSLYKISTFLCYVGVLVLITTIINVPNWFYIIGITILLTLIIVQIIFRVCMKKETNSKEQ